MPQKTKTGETQPNPVAAGTLAASNAPGRASRTALKPNPAKRGAIPGLKSRPSRRGASLSTGSAAEPSENRGLAESSAAPTATHPTPPEARPARKGRAGKKSTAGSVVSGRSSSVKARSTRKDSEAPDLLLQPEGGVGLHPGESSAAGGNGHLDHNKVARLAYSYWEARGCQGGSPEDDWYRALAELRQHKLQTLETKPRSRTRKK